MADPIEELAGTITRDMFGCTGHPTYGTAWGCIEKHLRAANITFPPQPPKPGSLWQHKETGERRFVTVPTGEGNISWRGGRWSSYGSDATEWHAWAANADCLCEGVDSK